MVKRGTDKRSHKRNTKNVLFEVESKIAFYAFCGRTTSESLAGFAFFLQILDRNLTVKYAAPQKFTKLCFNFTISSRNFEIKSLELLCPKQ